MRAIYCLFRRIFYIFRKQFRQSIVCLGFITIHSIQHCFDLCQKWCFKSLLLFVQNRFPVVRWKFKTKLFVEKSRFLKYRVTGIENYGETKSIAVVIKKYLNNLNDCGKKRIFSFFVTKNEGKSNLNLNILKQWILQLF